MKNRMLIGGWLIAALSFTGCQDSDFQPDYVTLNLPDYFPAMVIPDDNPLTRQGIALGRKIYYDQRMHSTQQMSCSSCHEQASSFTTAEANCMAHINLAWHSAFLWNGKIEGTLEDVAMFELVDFFGTDINVFLNDTTYHRMFKEAFNIKSDEITFKYAAYALAQFLRTMNSYNSKYDQWKRGEYQFSPSEWNGFVLFNSERGECFHCHANHLFVDNEFHDIGLDMSPSPGRFTMTGNQNDFGKFKTPTLRNIELTAPYMHDGRFQTLEEVMNFYSSGVQNSDNVTTLLPAHNGGLNLTAQEKADIIAFMKTLTDNTYITNPDLSAP